jgi:hypothetical protein
MNITDKSLGELFEKLGLITAEQKSFILKSKKEAYCDLNFYQIAIQLGYIRKGSLDTAMGKFRTEPGCKEK